MINTIKKIAVIGTGVIGTGWIIRLLWHNKKIFIFNRNKNQRLNVFKEIKRSNRFAKALYKNKKVNLKNLIFVNSIKEAVKEAELIQESITENYNLKIKIMKKIGIEAKKNAIIASSTSGLLPSKIYSKCKHPERSLVAHPFNPVYLLPGVELVPGKKTKLKYMNKAKNFYKSIAMYPLMIKKELPGFLANRLQESLWREALHIVNEGYASTEDLDRSLEDGPGPRYSIMGTFLTFHLAGGKDGMKHMLEQFGPTLKLPWTKLKAPTLSKKLSQRLISGTKKQAKGKTIEKISNLRDEYLINLLRIRKKFEKKLR